MKQNKQQGNRQRQQNNNGICRRSSITFGRGSGICRPQSSERFQAKSVITPENSANDFSLKLLREQAERMTKALEEIQARIKLAEQQ